MCSLRLISLGFMLFVSTILCGPAAVLVQAQEADPQPDIEALQRRALDEGESGQSVEAIRDYQRVLNLRPDWREGWWNLGTIQYSTNRYPDAATTLRKVVEFAPGVGMAWGLLGLSEFETRDFTDALAHLEKAHSLGIKEDAETERVSIYHLCLLLIRTGEFDRATSFLLASFAAASPAGSPSAVQIAPQVKIALGLAMLRVPLLPEEVDSSQEALLQAAGNLASSPKEMPVRCPAFLQSYADVPYAHYACGMALAATGFRKEALQLLLYETVLSPDSPLPWIEINRIDVRLGDAKAAATAAEKARLLQHQLTTAARDPEQRIVQRYRNASVGLARVTRAEDSQLWNRAMQEYSTGHAAEAATDLKDWLLGNPDNGTAWAVLGLSEFLLGEYDNSLIHLERGQKLGVSGSPESVQSAKYTLGILLIRTAHFERASEVLASALKAGPLDARVEFALGLALLRIPELPGQSTVRTNDQPNGLVAAAGKIATLLYESQYDAAFPLLKELIRQHPSTPFLHYAYGSALLSLSQFEEAAMQMRTEIAISPASELPLVRLASIALREHHPADAIPWARQALQIAADSPDAHYLLGRAALESGDNATAVHELESAANLSPASPEVHFNLAKAYARAALPDKATKEREEFARLNKIAEFERSHHGSQAYEGPHDAADVSISQSEQKKSEPKTPEQ